jgi:hypothetical protein
MERYAIVKNGIVLNAVEYPEKPIGTPPGFDEGAVAIKDSWAAVGWVYANGVFTNPTPPAPLVMPATAFAEGKY